MLNVHVKKYFPVIDGSIPQARRLSNKILSGRIFFLMACDSPQPSHVVKLDNGLEFK